MITFDIDLEKKVFVINEHFVDQWQCGISVITLDYAIDRMVSKEKNYYRGNVESDELVHQFVNVYNNHVIYDTNNIEDIIRAYKVIGMGDIDDVHLLAQALNFDKYSDDWDELMFDSLTDALITAEKSYYDDDSQIIQIDSLKNMNLSDVIVEGQNIMIGFDKNFNIAHAFADRYKLDVVYLQKSNDSYTIIPPVHDDKTPYIIGLTVKHC